MQLQPEERAIIADVARQLGVEDQALGDALEHESVPELARLLGISEAEATSRLEPVRRTVAFGDDWGAGCMLLTDEMRADLHAALYKLLPA
jgi:hypothetical protein